VDLEMAFVGGSAVKREGGWGIGGEEVREVVEGMVRKVWKDIKGVEMEDGFQVMPYDTAMEIVSVSWERC
jgi:aspartyl-tRNA synthetase